MSHPPKICLVLCVLSTKNMNLKCWIVVVSNSMTFMPNFVNVSKFESRTYGENGECASLLNFVR